MALLRARFINLRALLSAVAPHAWAGRYLDTSIALAGSPSDCYVISHVAGDTTISTMHGQHATLRAAATELTHLGLLRAVAT